MRLASLLATVGWLTGSPSAAQQLDRVRGDTPVATALRTWDFSAFKDVHASERTNLQFRLEIFNLFNRANFNTPNLITHVLQAPPNATFPEQSPTAGQITSTSTTSRQIQLGLKLLW